MNTYFIEFNYKCSSANYECVATTVIVTDTTINSIETAEKLCFEKFTGTIVGLKIAGIKNISKL